MKQKGFSQSYVLKFLWKCKTILSGNSSFNFEDDLFNSSNQKSVFDIVDSLPLAEIFGVDISERNSPDVKLHKPVERAISADNLEYEPTWRRRITESKLPFLIFL